MPENGNLYRDNKKERSLYHAFYDGRILKGKAFVASILFISFLFCCTNIFAAVETIPAGSKIINMGVTPQTTANGLKPYGLVYALLKNNTTVKWVINPNKVKDGIDFTHNGISYK